PSLLPSPVPGLLSSPPRAHPFPSRRFRRPPHPDHPRCLPPCLRPALPPNSGRPPSFPPPSSAGLAPGLRDQHHHGRYPALGKAQPPPRAFRGVAVAVPCQQGGKQRLVDGGRGGRSEGRKGGREGGRVRQAPLRMVGRGRLLQRWSAC
ncbi:hypothetical protein Naga_101802g1, partial [Nannochloropsis gaditana]